MTQIQAALHGKKAKVQEEPDDLKDWGKSKSFNDSISREEQLQRNMHVDG